MYLTQERKSKYQIVIPEEASDVETFATEELRKYLERISGASLAITTDIKDGRSILVGTTERWRKKWIAIDDSQLSPEGFIIRTVGDNLILSGKDELGTLFSIYTFLENLGCRWFYPGPEGEDIPKRKDIKLNSLDIAENPVMKYRGICPLDDGCQFDLSNPVKYIQFVDWLPKVKQNFFYMYCRRYNKKVLEEAARRGLKIEFGSHSFNFFFIGHKKYQTPVMPL